MEYGQFLERHIDEAKVSFDQALRHAVQQTRSEKGAGAAGQPRRYSFRGELIALTAPNDHPPAPLKMTFLLSVGETGGPPIDSLEIDTTSDSVDFQEIGAQLAKAVEPYAEKRLTCWTPL